jgi:hypothetical protein
MKNPIKLTFFIAALAISAQSMADIVVVGSKGLPELSAQEARQIFLKRTVTFANGTPAIPIDLADSIEIKWDFYNKVVGKEKSEVYNYWMRALYNSIGEQPEQVSTVADLKKRLQQSGVVGYIDAKDVEPDMNVLLRIQS